MPTTPEELTTQLTTLNGDPDTAAAVAIDVYKQARSGEREALQPWKQVQGQAKEVISDLMLELQTDRLETPAGKAYVPRPGVTVKYDVKALDRLCLERPEVRELLWPYRVEKERPGHLTVR